MSRPRKPGSDRRDRRLRLRLTGEEDLSVKMKAAAAGLTVAEFGRRCVLKRKITPPASRVDAQVLVELNRIGVNVNQLAHAFNADREFRGAWEAVYEELVRVIDKVASQFDPG